MQTAERVGTRHSSFTSRECLQCIHTFDHLHPTIGLREMRSQCFGCLGRDINTVLSDGKGRQDNAFRLHETPFGAPILPTSLPNLPRICLPNTAVARTCILLNESSLAVPRRPTVICRVMSSSLQSGSSTTVAAITSTTRLRKCVRHRQLLARAIAPITEHSPGGMRMAGR